MLRLQAQAYQITREKPEAEFFKTILALDIEVVKSFVIFI